MKKQIGVKLGVTFALLFSFLFSTPTPQYQAEAAKTKTEEKAKIKRTANKKITVNVKKYIDGDTTRFKLKNGKNITAKYLLIDTPELKKESPYAKEAKNRTKELLKNAKKIQIEYDKGKKRDSKKRELVYVWADGKLVQETLANEGLGMVRSTKSKNTKYQDKIKKAEQQAKERKQNIWSIENYAQADKGYNQAAVTAHLKALEEEIAAKKAEAERQKKEQEAKEAEEKRAAEQAEAAKKAEEKRIAEEKRRLDRPKNNASLKKQRRKLKQRKLHVLSKRPRLSRLLNLLKDKRFTLHPQAANITLINAATVPTPLLP